MRAVIKAPFCLNVNLKISHAEQAKIDRQPSEEAYRPNISLDEIFAASKLPLLRELVVPNLVAAEDGVA